ncbi:MAG: hypothetical protein WCA56_24660 [Xanthobacteraceae bacterium]
MANFILLVAILLASASFLGSNGSSLLGADYSYWIYDMCTAVPVACQSPRLTEYVAAAMAIFWILLKLATALRS